MNSSTLQEHEIVAQVRSGNTESFAAIYDAYVEPIYRFIYFKVSSRELAEDLTSETFLKVFHFIREVRSAITSMRALLYRAARNLVIDYYRTKERETVELTEAAVKEIGIDRRNLERAVDHHLQLQQIEVYLRQLSDEWREVIILRYVEEYTNAEIAEMLEKSEGAVRVMVHRAMEQLRKLISEKVVTFES